MNIKNYITARKKGSIIILIFFLLLIGTLIFRKTIPFLFTFSLIFTYLIIYFAQLYDFDSRVYISCALLLLICCPFFLIFKNEIIAENFAIYVFGFLCIGILGFFIDNLREKSKKNGRIKAYKIITTIIMILVILSTSWFYFRNIFYLFLEGELFFLKKTNIDRYYEQKYKSMDNMIVYGKLLKNKTKVNIVFPENGNVFVDNFEIMGWVTDEDLKYLQEIDKVEIWLDGVAGKGQLLKNAHLKFKNNIFYKEFDDKYKNSFSYSQIYVSGVIEEYHNPEIKEGRHDLYIYTHDPNFGWNFGKVKIEIKKYSDAEKIKDAEIQNEKFKIQIDKPKELEIINTSFDLEGWVLDQNSDANSGVDQIEVWLDGLPGKGNRILIEKLNKERSDVLSIYGDQYLKTGYLYKIPINNFNKGKHVIYIFAHSVFSGWSSKSVNLEIK